MQVGSSCGLIFQHLARFRQHQDNITNLMPLTTNQCLWRVPSESAGMSRGHACCHWKAHEIGTEKFSRILSAWESLPIDNFPIQGSKTGSADPRSTLSDAFLATMVALNGIPADESYSADTSIGGIIILVQTTWYRCANGERSSVLRGC